MKFIHAADIHLDSPLVGLSAYQDAPADTLRNATREAFQRLVDMALDERVDFMVIAGDLYDGDWEDFNTGVFFARQMRRLQEADIRVFVLHGNHDAESKMTRKLELPDNVSVFTARKPCTFEIEALRVALHGQSFPHAAVVDNLAIAYPAPKSGWLNIGVLHTALEGGTVHANYAPCSLEQLRAKNYQYWALGHVHEFARWGNQCPIVYPGNLQGRHIRETGKRGAVLVTAHGTDVESVERIYCDVLRWTVLDVDVSAAQDMDETVREVHRQLEAKIDTDGERMPLAVRIKLTGATPAHGDLFGRERELRAQVLAQAAALGEGRVWVEKLLVETSPSATPEQIAARMDAVAELQEILSSVDADQTFMARLKGDLDAVLTTIPAEALRSVPSLDGLDDDKLGNLVRATVPAVIARLARSE